MSWSRSWPVSRKATSAIFRAAGFKIFGIPGAVIGGLGYWNVLAADLKPVLVVPGEMILGLAVLVTLGFLFLVLVQHIIKLEDTRAPEIELTYHPAHPCFDTRYSDGLFIHAFADSVSEEGIRDAEVWIEGVDELNDQHEVVRSIAIARMNLSWSRFPAPYPEKKFGSMPILRTRELFDVLIWYYHLDYFALEVERHHPVSIRHYPLNGRYRITIGSSANSPPLRLIVAFNEGALTVRTEGTLAA